MAKRRGTNVRNQTKAQQAAAKRRTRINIVIAGLAGVTLIMVGVATWQSVPPAPPTTTAPTSQTTIPDSTPTVFIPPHGTAEMGWIEISAAQPKPGALIVNSHTDYKCSWCGMSEYLFGSSMRTLAERGDIILRMHVRIVYGQEISLRASMASTCADVVGKFLDYHEVLFANQAHEGDWFPDEELRVDFARQAGITGDDLTKFQSCYDSGQTKDYVLGMEQINYNSTTINGSTQDPIRGTPVFFVNGVKMPLGTMIVQDADKVWHPTFDTSPEGMLSHLKEVANQGSGTGG